MKKAYAEIKEGLVHYAADGSGEPLLLLARSPRSWTYYRRLLPLLATKRRAIAMDTMGFGNSDPAPAGYKIPDYAGTVVRFLDALGIERTDLWGTFTGSTIALEVAIRWPERIRRLVLMGIPLFRNQDERQSHMDFAKSFAAFAPNANGEFLKDIWEWFLRKAQITDQENLDPQWVRDNIMDALRAGPGYVQMIMNSYAHDVLTRAPLVQKQTLVIGLTGENVFWFIRGDRAKEVQGLIPGSRLAMIDGPGAHEEVTTARADDLAKLVLPFLDSKDSRA